MPTITITIISSTNVKPFSSALLLRRRLSSASFRRLLRSGREDKLVKAYHCSVPSFAAQQEKSA